MRILIVTNLYPNPWQPHRAVFNRQQFAAMAKTHAVRVISPVAWTDQFGASAQSDTVQSIYNDGITVDYPRFVFPPKVFRSWHGEFCHRSIRPAFQSAVKEFQPDVVLSSWAYPDAWAALKLSREAGLPMVAKVHGSDVLLLSNEGSRRRLTTDALRGADAVIAVSQQLADKTVDLGVEANRVHVVYNGIDPSIFFPGKAAEARQKLQLSNEPLLLFVGNLAPVKNLPVLIDACAELRERNISFQCRLIGQGALQSELNRRIHAAGLDERMKLIGPRPLEELPDWYRAASLLVLPSRSEGIPNVILEALACGVPVVASRVGGIPEILPRQSLVDPNNPMALAEAIQDMLFDPVIEIRHTRDWNESANDVLDVLAGVAGKSRRIAA
jgi:glycosyltransferase involved in cell wall biosynthesis